jgi:sugar lactone lactonase YvrE
MTRDAQIDFAFGSNGRFKQGRMDSPCCVAIDQNNNFLVTDSTNNCVHVFTELGIFVKSIGKQSALLGLLVTSDGRFSGPTGVLIDHYDNIVVADTKHNRIIMYDSDWNFLRKFGTKGNQDNEYDAPWGLAIDRSSRIFVSDMNNHRIVVLDTNGKFLSEFGRHGSATGQFKKPKGIAILHNESIIVVDSHNHRLQMFNLATFQHVRTIGQKGTKDGQFMYPSCVTVGPNGTIIVSDTENNRVQIFDSRGGFLTYLSSKEVIEKPIGLCVNDYGHIVVVNSATSRILVVK